MSDFRQAFIEFAIQHHVLRFGEFKTKAGRISPYFFNFGLFNDGDCLRQLGQFYAKAVITAQPPINTLFGPAYKGIPLVSAVAIALSEKGYNYPFCFNRKEAKNHGEGGVLIGASLTGYVLIVDDVISAGTSVRESVDLINSSGAKPGGVVIALDRMEKGKSELSAVQEIKNIYQIPVISIADLNDLVRYLRARRDLRNNLKAVEHYRAQYGTG